MSTAERGPQTLRELIYSATLGWIYSAARRETLMKKYNCSSRLLYLWLCPISLKSVCDRSSKPFFGGRSRRCPGSGSKSVCGLHTVKSDNCGVALSALYVQYHMTPI